MPEGLERELNALPADEAAELGRIWALAADAPLPHDPVGKDTVRRTVMAEIAPSFDRAPLPGPMATIRRLASLRLVVPVRAQLVAAALALLVAVSFVMSPDVTSVRAPVGTVTGLSVDLPDGSSVRLAPGARLFYTDRFDETDRSVRLHGEAFFDVQKSSKPFVIGSYDATTTVLGTRFNVESWPGALAPQTEVVVESGTVRVEQSKSGAAVTLAPGESALVSEVASAPRHTPDADVIRATSWRDGGFAYDNAPVGDVLDEVSRRFDVQVDAPASIRLRRVSIWKQTVTEPSELLGDLSATIGVRYRRTANGFDLYFAE